MPDFAGLALIHAAAFTHPRPWSAAEIADLATAPGGFVAEVPGGFVLGRVVLDEAELLTIAVDPAHRRQGRGAALLEAFHAQALALGAGHAFLEVAADNPAAQALYLQGGWVTAGKRRGYYRSTDGQPVDAIVMSRALI